VTSKSLHVSPYELWNNKKPNLDYFKLWGCISFYRVHDHQRTKLGPRGIKSIFVGYAQNSKAYRLLDLESNVIIESIHVENNFLDNIVDEEMTEPNESDNNAYRLSHSEITTSKKEK